MPEATETTAQNPTEAVTPTTETAATDTTLLGGAKLATETQQPAAPEAAEVPKDPAADPETPEDPEGAPEKYEFKAPDGQTYDTNILEAFSASAKEANLTQEAAQKLLDTMSSKIAARQAEQVKAVTDGWTEYAKSDKEFGGEKLAENLGIAKKALDAFGSPELAKMLDGPLGNNPEVIRFCYRIGKAISEDGFVSGRAPAAKPVSITSVLYDKTN